jgi:hypothetical protein
LNYSEYFSASLQVAAAAVSWRRNLPELEQRPQGERLHMAAAARVGGWVSFVDEPRGRAQ